MKNIFLCATALATFVLAGCQSDNDNYSTRPSNSYDNSNTNTNNNWNSNNNNNWNQPSKNAPVP